MRLKQAGQTNFAVYEKDAGVGGTWWANRYPGAACDIPSHLYSFSFAPNPDWTRKYPEQAEIEAYLNDCVDRFGVRPHLRLNASVEGLRWQEGSRLWHVRTHEADGRTGTLSARAVVLATGGLSRPADPQIDGLDQFKGLVLHTARWPQGFDLSGKRVGVIGTGASAVQVVPQLAQTAAHVSVFQRTPAWVMPRFDHPIGPARRWLLRHVPALRLAYRAL